jgi:hypothetical protein
MPVSLRVVNLSTCDSVLVFEHFLAELKYVRIQTSHLDFM